MRDMYTNEIVSLQQLWTFDGTILQNKANEFRSYEHWKLRIKIDSGGKCILFKPSY